LLGNHLHGVFLFDNDHLEGSSRWRSSRGCHSISFIVIIVILIVAVLAILVSELHDELIMRLDYSFQLGLLLPQLPSVFPQLLA
jgi:uncharacterized membrane protein YhaH (DUF805 family)